MSRRASRPEEEPPRKGGWRAWLAGAVTGIVAVAFVALAIVVLVVVLLA